MLSKGFNKEFFESVYRLNECGGTGTGGCGANKASCGGGSCGTGFTESLQRMNECGDSGYSISYSSCGGSGYSSSGCGGWSSHSSSHSCEIGRRVRIIIDGSCGGLTEVGRLLGYAD